jgi:hypothetical protein
MKRHVLSTLLILLLVIGSRPVQQTCLEPANPVTSQTGSSKLLSGVPYVWQEINGFCAWASLTSVLNYLDVDLDLYDLFSVTGTGFSFVYIQYNDTLTMFPGVLYKQIEPTQFVADLYGLNLSVYLSGELAGAEDQAEVWRSQGTSVGLLEGQSAAFDLMRRAIDSGYPVVASVDPSWLPTADYDVLREQGLTGGAHAVVIVGYDDAEGKATILDPGVGSFGENRSYPQDGRGNYSEITYTSLNKAWSNRYYVSMLLKPDSDDAPSDFADRLGPYVRDRLLGVGSSYDPNSAGAYLFDYGAKAFSQLANDLTAEGLSEFLGVFSEASNAPKLQSQILSFIGLGLQTQVTLQYLSYRQALSTLPSFFGKYNLSAFTSFADGALDNFKVLSHNSTLIFPGNESAAEGYVVDVFRSISMELNESGDLEGTLAAFQEDLTNITTHLQGIANSWLAAGEALADIWPNNALIIYTPFIIVGIAALVSVALTVYWWSKNRKTG